MASRSRRLALVAAACAVLLTGCRGTAGGGSSPSPSPDRSAYAPTIPLPSLSDLPTSLPSGLPSGVPTAIPSGLPTTVPTPLPTSGRPPHVLCPLGATHAPDGCPSRPLVGAAR